MVEVAGGRGYRLAHADAVVTTLAKEMSPTGRVVSTLPALSSIAEVGKTYAHPSALDDVDLFVAEASLGVAENGAVWLTETAMQLRALPFICKHLAIVINAEALVATMHDAYDRIGDDPYDFGTFVAGPSKTADIEQALVLGAHGPVSMRVFVVG